MPVSDFKCLESRHYVVWTLYYEFRELSRSQRAKLPPDATAHMTNYSEGQPREDRGIQMYKLPMWHNKEAVIRELQNIFSTEVVQHEHWSRSKLEVKKELCVFDGTHLHSHTGKVWALADVERCCQLLEQHPNEALLKLLGKKPRQRRPFWQQFLCCLTCLCLFMDVDDIESVEIR